MIDKAFYVNYKGRDFVLFGGLLDAATKAGLKSVTTDIKQMPDASNGNLAVVTSRIEFEDGRVFAEVGDASPASVGSMIIPHLLRMASTRAIGRAFRLGLNISATMKEELGGDDDEAPANHAHRPPANGKPAPVSPPRSPSRPPAAGTRAAGDVSAAVCFCQFPKCENEIDQVQKDTSELAYGVAVCEKHSYLQPQPATTSKGEPILCAECQQQLTNNEVLLSHRDCKRKLCRVHRLDAVEAKNAETAAVPA